MAPPLAMRAESVASLGFSTPVMGSLGSVAPVIIMILLLLLCFPFRRDRPLKMPATDAGETSGATMTRPRPHSPRDPQQPRRELLGQRKKRQLSTRTLKNSASSELLSITKLEDGQHLQEKPLEDGTWHKGSSLSNNPGESQTNGCVAHFLPANSSEHPGTMTPDHQKRGKSEMTDSEQASPQASCPNATSPGSLQLRKLPMTPREEDISRTELPNPGMDGRVYESIKDEERKLCSGNWPKGQESSGSLSRSSSCATVGSAESGVKEDRTAEVTGMQPPSSDASVLLTVTLEHSESHPQLQVSTGERDAPTESASDVEKRLRAMYARVCKKPKTEQQFQPANHDRPVDDREEEPPPIPEKRFDDIYESIDPETQGSEMPIIITPPNA